MLASAFKDRSIPLVYYMALICGQYNARSDWLRAHTYIHTHTNIHTHIKTQTRKSKTT